MNRTFTGLAFFLGGIASLSSSAWARCSGYAGDKVIQSAWTGCDSKALSASIHSDPAFAACVSSVQAVCMNGCYNPFGEPTPGCVNQYSAALSACQPMIDAKAKGLKCERVLAGTATAAPATRGSNCKWISRETLDLNCGGSRDAKLCSGRGRSICSGYVECSAGTAKDDLPAGVHPMACLTKSGYCQDVAIADCANDDNIQLAADTQGEYIEPKGRTGRSSGVAR